MVSTCNPFEQAAQQDGKQDGTMFENPFQITDLLVFDDEALKNVLAQERFGLSAKLLAHSVQGAPRPLVRRMRRALPARERALFVHTLHQPVSCELVETARRQVLDTLFWELTYWKTPQLYETLIEGEKLHPAIFQQLHADINQHVVLDAGAGSGRATLECLRHGASLVYAVEPSPGLLRILQQKLTAQKWLGDRIKFCDGRFDALPLADNSVDIALSCSAFTSLPGQGGEPGLAELLRVTRPGGKIIIIWPRVEDRDWLNAHGFHYVSIPLKQEMHVRFRSWQSAIQCVRRFYARNRAVLSYLRNHHGTTIPFSVLGMNPPHEYCWLEVKKSVDASY